jgi:predicted esterase
MTDSAVRSIEAVTHGRYLVHPPDDRSSSRLLVAFHGYRENAEQHLANVLRIPGASAWLVVSVQALHRFYTKGGDVVASWMTKQDRDEAIRDNVRYVGDVVAAVKAEHGAGGPLVFVGFSQGVAMAYRAAAGAGHACDGIIVLAGDVPPELQAHPPARFPPTLIGCGAADKWYTREKLERDRVFFDANRFDVDTCVFDGGHEWAEVFLRQAGAFLQKLTLPDAIGTADR